jgi:hypothetical protein
MSISELVYSATSSKLLNTCKDYGNIIFQNYWGSAICPLSGIKNLGNISGTESVSVLR